MITVTGSLAFDYIMDFPGKFSDHIMPDKIHQINLSFLLSDLKKQNGGTAGNIAYTLALLKSPVSILACSGEDFADYLQFLKNTGVDTSNIKIVPDKKTASAFIMTDKLDNQITGFYPGAMSENSTLSIPKTDFVVISPNSPDAMVKFAKECKASSIRYMMDPGMQLPSLSADNLKSMIEGAEILVGNDYEMELMSNKLQNGQTLHDRDTFVHNLLENIKILITTLGENGSIIQTKNQTIEIKAAKPQKVIDPTGAGDAYRAGFLAGYLKNFDLKVCGQMGSIASCYAVEKYGTTQHKFSVEEFKQRYKENFGDTLQLSSRT